MQAQGELEASCRGAEGGTQAGPGDPLRAGPAAAALALGLETLSKSLSWARWER